MRKALQITCALLIALAAYLLLLSKGAPEGWPSEPKPDEQGHELLPLPLPIGETHDAARDRAQITHRPLLLLFMADWCPTCKPVLSLHTVMKLKGELGIINIDQQPDLREFYHVRAVPTLLVYQYESRQWRLLGAYVGFLQITGWVNPGETPGTVEGQDWSPADRPAAKTEPPLTDLPLPAGGCPDGSCTLGQRH